MFVNYVYFALSHACTMMCLRPYTLVLCSYVVSTMKQAINLPVLFSERWKSVPGRNGYMNRSYRFILLTTK